MAAVTNLNPRDLLHPVRCAQCADIIAHMPAGFPLSGPEPFCVACTGFQPRPYVRGDNQEAAARFLRLALRTENLFLATRWVRAADLWMKLHRENRARSGPLPDLTIDLKDIL